MKIIAFIFASFMIIIMTGCGGGSSSSGSSESSSSSSPEIVVEIPDTGSGSLTLTGVRGLSNFPAVPAIPE